MGIGISKTTRKVRIILAFGFLHKILGYILASCYAVALTEKMKYQSMESELKAFKRVGTICEG